MVAISFSLVSLAAFLAVLTAQPHGERTRYTCWHGGRWVQPGTQWEAGIFWYECRDGKREPMGCITDAADGRRRVRMNEKSVSSGYERTCVLDNGYLTWKTTGCAPEEQRGRSYRPGETWEDSQGKFWFECVQTTPYHVVPEIRGCLTDRRERIPVGQMKDFPEQELYYECAYRGTERAVAFCTAGCLDGNRRHKIGESWEDGDYIYYCKPENPNDCKSKMVKFCIGCVFGGQELSDGDRYERENSIFECNIRPGIQDHRLVGCIQTSPTRIERRLGCVWFENYGSQHFEKECVEDGDIAKAETKGCIYLEAGEEMAMVQPDSYTIWWHGGLRKEVGLACKPSYPGSKEYALEEFEPADLAYRASGLNYAPPRGRKKRSIRA